MHACMQLLAEYRLAHTSEGIPDGYGKPLMLKSGHTDLSAEAEGLVFGSAIKLHVNWKEFLNVMNTGSKSSAGCYGSFVRVPPPPPPVYVQHPQAACRFGLAAKEPEKWPRTA